MDSECLPPVPARSATEQSAAIASFTISIVIVLLSFGSFLYFRPRYQRLKVRIPLLLLFYGLAVVFIGLGLVLPLFASNFPCWLQFAFTALGAGGLLVTNLTRSSVFMLMTRLATTTYECGRIPIEEASAEEQRYGSMKPLSKLIHELVLLHYALRLFFTPASTIATKIPREEQIKTLLALRLMTQRHGSLLFAMLVYMPTFIIILVVCLAVPQFSRECMDCPTNNTPIIITFMIFGGFILLNSQVFVLKCRHFPDVWGVFQEGRISSVFATIGFTCFILLCFLEGVPMQGLFGIGILFGFLIGFCSVTLLQVGIAIRMETPIKMHSSTVLQATANSKSNDNNEVATYSEDGTSSNNNNVKQKLSAKGLSTRFHPQHTKSSDAAPATPQAFAHGGETAMTSVSDLQICPDLEMILSNPTLLRAFEYHLSCEFAQENLAFLQDTWAWKSNFFKVAPNANVATARKLANTYISSSGFFQVNISSAMANKMLGFFDPSKNHPEEEAITQNFFDKARREIASLLEKGPVARFKNTAEYSRVISGDAVLHVFA